MIFIIYVIYVIIYVLYVIYVISCAIYVMYVIMYAISVIFVICVIICVIYAIYMFHVVYVFYEGLCHCTRVVYGSYGMSAGGKCVITHMARVFDRSTLFCNARNYSFINVKSHAHIKYILLLTFNAARVAYR